MLFAALEEAEQGGAGFDYSRFVALANRLLTRFGQRGTLERPVTSGPAHSPVQQPPLKYPAIFVIGSFKAHEVDGTRILREDKKAIIAPSLQVEPKLSDLLVEADGGRFRLVNLQTLRPAATTIAYVAQVRR